MVKETINKERYLQDVLENLKQILKKSFFGTPYDVCIATSTTQY